MSTNFLQKPLIKDLPAIVCLAALTALFFAPVVFTDKTFIARDNYIFFNPRQAFAAESVRDGEIPFWNPYLACGQPFQANLQNSLFYPFSMLCYALPFQIGFKLYIVFHYFLAAVFMYALMKAWAAPRSAAFVAGIVFAFGGYFTSINDYVAFLTAGAWLPCIVLCLHYCISLRSSFFTLLTAAAIGMQIFAGDASNYVLSSFICTFLYTILWMIRAGLKSIYPLVLLGLAWLLGILLAAVQLLPFAEFVMHSLRSGGLGLETALNQSFHPYEFFQLLLPYIFGPSVPNIRWFGQTWLDTFYIGIFPLLCCLMYLVFSRWNRLKVFLCLVVGISIFLCLGRYNPLYPLLCGSIPGLNMIQYPVKFLYLAAFALSAMAGWGFVLFAEKIEEKSYRRKSLFIGGVFFVLTFFFICMTAFYKQGYEYFLNSYFKDQYYLQIAENLYFGIFQNATFVFLLTAGFLLVMACRYKGLLGQKMLLIIVVICIVSDLFWIGKPADPYVDQDIFYKSNKTLELFAGDSSLFRVYSLMERKSKKTFWHVYDRPFESVYSLLKEGQQTNLNMYEHISSAQEYGELKLKNYYDLFQLVGLYFDQRFTSNTNAGARECLNVLSLLNVKYIVSPYSLDDLPLELVSDGLIKIYRNPAVLPRAFFPDRVVVTDTDTAGFKKMQDCGYDFRSAVFITRDSAKKSSFPLSTLEGPVAKRTNATVQISRYEPNAINLVAENDKPAMLVVTDNYYPGWQAYDNGKPVAILRVNSTFRGIPLAAGRHVLELKFRPVLFYIGAAISLLVLLLISGGLWCLRSKKTALPPISQLS